MLYAPLENAIDACGATIPGLDEFVIYVLKIRKVCATCRCQVLTACLYICEFLPQFIQHFIPPGEPF